MYPGRRRGNNYGPRGKCEGEVVAISVCGATIVATVTAWVHRGSVQLANTTIVSTNTERKNLSLSSKIGPMSTLESTPGFKHKLENLRASRLFLGGAGVRFPFSLCAPIVLLNDATFLQMTRLLQVTKTSK